MQKLIILVSLLSACSTTVPNRATTTSPQSICANGTVVAYETRRSTVDGTQAERTVCVPPTSR